MRLESIFFSPETAPLLVNRTYTVLQLSPYPDTARVELFFSGKKIEPFFLLITYHPLLIRLQTLQIEQPLLG